MSVPGPVLGPCTAWIDGADVAACCTADIGSAGADAFETAALEASMALYEISGRVFTGLCGPVTVRPCSDRCSCWGAGAFGPGPWSWSAAWYGGSPSWYWQNECGDKCGCGPLSRITLNGYPVREIVEVKIDGVVLDPAAYRLDQWRYLTRMDDAGPPAVQQRWPGCQNLALDDDQPGTWSVSYRYGVDPPQIGRDAAAQLACEIYKACSGQACKLPSNTTKVQRQGVTIERNVLLAFLDPKKPSGLLTLDLFLASYWAKRASRRPMTWSPDGPQFPRRVGT